ncbi:MAG: hypothetical protein PVI56_00445, partial [Gammaproteobacteria bacterium]
MNRKAILLGLMSLALAAGGAAAAAESDNNSNQPDTSGWECKYCVFPTGWFGDVGAGLGYIGEDAFRFGDYTGMEDKGIFIDA